MAKTIKIDEMFFDDAQYHAKISKRSVPKQIEYWSVIGKIAEENPDLNYNFIKEILIGLEDIKSKRTSKYNFGI